MPGMMFLHNVNDVNLVENVGSVNFSNIAGSTAIAVIGNASDGNAITVSDGSQTFVDHGTDQLIHDLAGELTATLANGYTTIDVDMAAGAKLNLSGFHTTNGMILLTGLSAPNDVQVAYQNGDAIVTAAGTSGSVTLMGVNHVGTTGSVGNVDFSKMTDSHAVALLV
jgi:hypothetical protein